MPPLFQPVFTVLMVIATGDPEVHLWPRADTTWTWWDACSRWQSGHDADKP